MIYLVRRKGLFFILFILVIFCLAKYYCELTPIVKADNMEFNVTIKPFYEESEYVTYFNNNSLSDINSSVRIDLNWNLNNISSFDQNLYTPYIVIIPLEKGWLYAGTHKNIPALIGNRTSINEEIIEKVFHNDRYDWQNIDLIGIHTRPQSFNQGFITVSFKKSNLNAKASPLFKIYLIYYDPVRKAGWYKVIKQEANFSGLP